MAGAKVVSLNELADELEAYTKSQIEDLKAATVRGIARSIPLLVERSPVDTGLYAQSWDFTATEYGAILGNYAPYSGVIEYGMRPGHWVPIEPLLAWAKRVLTNTQGNDGKPIKTGQPESGYSDEVVALARGTQRKIYERGLLPRHVMRDAIPEIIENIKREYLSLGK